MAKASLKKRLAALESESDPHAPLDSALFLAAAGPVLGQLTKDLLSRAEASPAVTEALRARHASDKERKRTAESFSGWRAAFVDQVAAAWLLSCVFVRMLEDRGLLEHPRLAGPGALDSQRLFFEMAPSLTERDYLLTVFRELSRLPAARDLFDAKHNPVWLLSPSAEAAKALLNLFRMPQSEAPGFRFGQPETRFLGDLYQDLNESVKKRYALLQTPRFVEQFILDRTLERALERFGLDDTDVIDPTCGSGHFLLGAFERLFDHRLRREPGLGEREAARLALEKVAGADINPYAVAIARFRLTLAFLEKAGYRALGSAPQLPLNVVVADSLLHNPHAEQTSFKDLVGQSAERWAGEEFALEDEEAAREVLHRQYAAVVGNPPYITVKDAVLRDRYRGMYLSAGGKYSLAAPFTERFFQLGRTGAAVGMITANSFMKREFGKKLIQEYLPTVNLDLIVNTSGAYIPGHGTPTVLLFGTSEEPQGTEVHVVLASRGEPSTPEDPEQGMVWGSIAEHWEETGFENEYITVVDLERESLKEHPWTLGGGGASELKALIEERAERRLGGIAESIGISCVTGEDDVYLLPPDVFRRLGIEKTRALVTGEYVRDWALEPAGHTVFLYDDHFSVLPPERAAREMRYLWPYRSVLSKRKRFGTPMVDRGLTWYELQELYGDKLRTPLTITFAFVATHNHFVLDRGGKVFNRSAPIIKLPEGATEDDHYALLAYLNSAVACFWMKQVFFDKGNRGEGGGLTAEQWEKFYEFDGTKLKLLPLPRLSTDQRDEAVRRAKTLCELADQRTRLLDLSDIFSAVDGSETLDGALDERKRKIDDLESNLRAEQENLDWLFYEAFGLIEQRPPDYESLAPGKRVSDLRFARDVLNGEAGRRYFDLCRLPSPESIAQDPSADPIDAQRIELTEQNRAVAAIEHPVFKRTFREGFRPLDVQAEAGAFVLELFEKLVSEVNSPITLSCIIGVASDKPQAAIRLAWPDRDTSAVVGQLIHDESVPYLGVLRFARSGITKHAEWQRTWAMQRRENAGEDVGNIPVPPKYKSSDYRRSVYWRLRGKLDVPKERFISYPGCESDEDGVPIYGWAGWNHAQRARALGTLYYQRKTEEAWSAERLTPMLTGLLELLPWLEQWHDEPDDDYGGQSPAQYFETFLDAECNEHHLTRHDLRTWTTSRQKKDRTLTSQGNN